MKDQKKTKKDPLRRLKYIGYCAACTPPEKTSFEDFIRFAKTYLCVQNRVLFKDPIWETYGDEEIIVEYFAHVFAKDPDKKTEFELQIEAKKSDYDEFLEFANKSIEDNAVELEDKAAEMEDSVSFSPDALGD